MGNIASAEQIQKIEMYDYVIIVVGGCQKRITYLDFIKDLVFGEIDLSAVVENSFEGIGTFTKPDELQPSDNITNNN